MRFIKRSIVEYLKKLGTIDKPVIITGMRGVGKSSAVQFYNEHIQSVSLSNMKDLLYAYNHGDTFFSKYQLPLIIKDIHYAPYLFKYIMDEKNKQVFFLASQQLDCINEYKEYMQGNSIYLELMGLSIYELANMGHIQKPFVPSKRPPCIISKKSMHHTYNLMWRGFFPDYDEKYVAEDNCTYAVSFNGKTRFTVDLPKSKSKEDVESEVRSLEQTAKYVGDGNIVKVIVVPGKIVNIVVR